MGDLSQLLIGLTLFSIIILGYASVWGDLGTNYGVTSRTLADMDESVGVRDDVESSSGTLSTEGSDEDIAAGGLWTGAMSFIDSLIDAPKRVNSMTTAAVRYLKLPQWVNTIIWTSASIIVIATVVYIFTGRKP